MTVTLLNSIDTKIHYPVMLNEVLQSLDIKPGQIYLDCTFGNGGYTTAILEHGGHVIALDQDINVLPKTREIKEKYPDQFNFVQGDFGNMVEHLKNNGFADVLFSGIVFDIGVSSMQIDNPERGFSFKNNGPLDMRMNQNNPLDAKTVVNTYDENDIANIIYEFGEEHHSFKIAKAICLHRLDNEITTTEQLANIVRGVVWSKNKKIDPATKTFQGLRIYVNQELSQLKQSLIQATSLLKPDGNLVVVTFHSLEDRIMKNFVSKYSPKKEHKNKYKQNADEPASDHYYYPCKKKHIAPSKSEISENKRSRSAKLRALTRTDKQFNIDDFIQNILSHKT